MSRVDECCLQNPLYPNELDSPGTSIPTVAANPAGVKPQGGQGASLPVDSVETAANPDAPRCRALPKPPEEPSSTMIPTHGLTGAALENVEQLNRKPQAEWGDYADRYRRYAKECREVMAQCTSFEELRELDFASPSKALARAGFEDERWELLGEFRKMADAKVDRGCELDNEECPGTLSAVFKAGVKVARQPGASVEKKLTVQASLSPSGKTRLQAQPSTTFGFANPLGSASSSNGKASVGLKASAGSAKADQRLGLRVECKALNVGAAALGSVAEYDHAKATFGGGVTASGKVSVPGLALGVEGKVEAQVSFKGVSAGNVKRTLDGYLVPRGRR